jgi:hypothetical protein
MVSAFSWGMACLNIDGFDFFKDRIVAQIETARYRQCGVVLVNIFEQGHLAALLNHISEKAKVEGFIGRGKNEVVSVYANVPDRLSNS